MREFDSGATRDNDADKLDFEGFLSPLVLTRYASYMHSHRKQADGELRDSDNWQKGIPLAVYMKSAWRHFIDWWNDHRGFETDDGVEEALCALIFNASGYLHELLIEGCEEDEIEESIARQRRAEVNAMTPEERAALPRFGVMAEEVLELTPEETAWFDACDPVEQDAVIRTDDPVTRARCVSATGPVTAEETAQAEGAGDYGNPITPRVPKKHRVVATRAEFDSACAAPWPDSLGPWPEHAP